MWLPHSHRSFLLERALEAMVTIGNVQQVYTGMRLQDREEAHQRRMKNSSKSRPPVRCVVAQPCVGMQMYGYADAFGAVAPSPMLDCQRAVMNVLPVLADRGRKWRDEDDNLDGGVFGVHAS